MAPHPEELCLSQQPRKPGSLKKGRAGGVDSRSHLSTSCKQSTFQPPKRWAPLSRETLAESGPPLSLPGKRCRRSHADFWKAFWEGFPEIPGFPECGGLSKGDVSEPGSDKGPPGRASWGRRAGRGGGSSTSSVVRGGGRLAYRGGGVGLGPVLQQDVDDVRVALLGGLVQRRVAVL